MGLMRRAWLVFLAAAAAAVLLLAQREPLAPPRGVAPWEYRALIPQEIGPGVYRQVDWYQVVEMGNQGWELVSVTPYVIRNDERKYKGEENPRIVTQNYLAYYFKRQRVRSE